MPNIQDGGMYSYFWSAWVCILHVLPRYEAWGTSRLVRYIEVYVIVNYVIASQFSMELMPFQRGLSVIIRNSEVYVISRVVISRFDLYKEMALNSI